MFLKTNVVPEINGRYFEKLVKSTGTNGGYLTENDLSDQGYKRKKIASFSIHQQSPLISKVQNRYVNIANMFLKLISFYSKSEDSLFSRTYVTLHGSKCFLQYCIFNFVKDLYYFIKISFYFNNCTFKIQEG